MVSFVQILPKGLGMVVAFSAGPTSDLNFGTRGTPRVLDQLAPGEKGLDA